MPSSLVVADTGPLLNLMATGRAEAIVEVLELELVMSRMARDEARFVLADPDSSGQKARVPVSTKALEEAGRLRCLDHREPAFAAPFVQAAAQLGDQDASCIALAAILQTRLLADDGKVRRVARELFPELALWSTTEVLHDVCAALSLDEKETLELVRRVRVRANFGVPHRSRPPRWEWYKQLVERAGCTP